MKVAGIICEYNPFHFGHKYQLEAARELSGADYVVALMSGNFTQRGVPGIFSKRTRVLSALSEGADMVLELPFYKACAPAGYFAGAGVGIFDATRVVTHLVFGSETGDLAALSEKISLIDSSEDGVRRSLSMGYSYAKAVGDAAGMEKGSGNDILAVEYLISLRRSQSGILPVTVKIDNSFKNASYLRDMAEKSLKNGSTGDKNIFDDFLKCVPEASAEIYSKDISEGKGPVFFNDLTKGIVSVIRSGGPEMIKRIPLCKEGLENRIYEAAKECTLAEELVRKCTSRRYTAATVRRILVWALVFAGNYDIPDPAEEPEYIRILGMRRSAFKLSSYMAERSSLPVVMSNKDALGISPLAEAEAKAGDVYNTWCAHIGPGRREYRDEMIII